MTEYIVCHRKRNAPRINIRVCREKCPSSGTCRDFLAWTQAARAHEAVPAMTGKEPFPETLRPQQTEIVSQGNGPAG